MPRRIIIPRSRYDSNLDVILQQVFRVLLSDGLSISAGSVNHHQDGTANATVLLKDEADRPRALWLLNDAGLLPDRNKVFARASALSALSCRVREHAREFAEQQSSLRRSLEHALQDLQQIEHRLEDLKRQTLALRQS